MKSGGLVTCLDASSGKPVFDRERLSDRSEYYLSPVGAGGRVLLGSAEGTLYVLDAEADDPEVLQQISFEEELFATPAVLDVTVYLRSKSTLWAFGSDQRECLRVLELHRRKRLVCGCAEWKRNSAPSSLCVCAQDRAARRALLDLVVPV